MTRCALMVLAALLTAPAWGQDGDEARAGSTKMGPPAGYEPGRVKGGTYPPPDTAFRDDPPSPMLLCKGEKCFPNPAYLDWKQRYLAGLGQPPREVPGAAPSGNPAEADDFNRLTNNPNLESPQAEANLRDAVEAAPTDPVANGYLGVVEFSRGDFEPAYRRFDVALANGPPDPDLYYLRGASALNLGRPKEAAADLTRAIQLRPEQTQARELLKLVRSHVSEKPLKLPAPDPGRPAASPLEPEARGPAGALPADPSRELGTRSDYLMKEAASRLRIKDYAGAAGLLGKALAANPKDDAARYVRADVLLRAGRPKEAAEEAGLVLAAVPGHAGALNIRALARNRDGDFSGALADAQAALKAKADSALAFYNIAYALAGLGRRGESSEALRSAAALDPSFAPARTRLAALPADADPLVAFDHPARAVHEPPAPPAPDTVAWRLLGAAGGVVFGAALFALWKRREAAPPGKSGVVLGGHYRVDGELGRGSMGVVLRATDLNLKRPVAVKLLRQSSWDRPEEAEKFLREAQLAAALKHPNIVQVHAAFREGPDVVLVFERVNGNPLSKVIADFHHLPFSDARDVVRQAASALDYAHVRRLIHRDLKPANIMVAPDGTASLMDLGLAFVAGSGEAQGAPGSPPYMAPEAEEGEASAASDIYSLGVTLYEMLTGALPFPGPDVLAQKKSLAFVPPSVRRRGVPGGVDAVIRRALEPSPAARFPTAGAFAAALDAVDGGRG